MPDTYNTEFIDILLKIFVDILFNDESKVTLLKILFFDTFKELLIDTLPIIIVLFETFNDEFIEVFPFNMLVDETIKEVNIVIELLKIDVFKTVKDELIIVVPEIFNDDLNIGVLSDTIVCVIFVTISLVNIEKELPLFKYISFDKKIVSAVIDPTITALPEIFKNELIEVKPFNKL